MSKEKIKKEEGKSTLAPTNTAILKKYTPEEAKELILRMGITGDINPVLKHLGDDLLPKWLHGTPEEKKKIKKELEEKASAVMYASETDTQVALMESFGERFRGSAKVICKQFIHDFDCKTDAEKIMAETAAIAFMRYLDASRRLNNCLDVNNTLSPIKTAYMAMLSKERDRAHRQYVFTVTTIKQLKAPNIELNIRTKNTFVAQNQQINANGSVEPTNTAINEA